MNLGKPMLAVDRPDSSDLLANPDWIASQKVDGDRVMVARVDTDPITVGVLNRKGEKSKHALGAPLEHLLTENLGGFWWFDGELVGSTIWVFDAIFTPTTDECTPYVERIEAAKAGVAAVNAQQHFRFLPTAHTTDEKITLAKDLDAHHAEGIIFRKADSPYEFGIRSPNMVKWKFWKDADVILHDIGRENKRSASMVVWRDGHLFDVGSVKLTDGQLETLSDGTVATIKYLYATRDGRLYQPSLLKLRTDKAADECDYNQLIVTNKEILPNG